MNDIDSLNQKGKMQCDERSLLNIARRSDRGFLGV
jgi:hypothetical protein